MKTKDWIKSAIRNMEHLINSQVADIERAQKRIKEAEEALEAYKEDLKKFDE